MPVEFRLPDLGEGIHEGEIIEVLVHVGDRVMDGQPVLIVETDKATAEVPSPVDGIVKEIRVKAGETIRVGDVLMVFLKSGESEEQQETPSSRTPEGKIEVSPPVEKETRPEAPTGKPAEPIVGSTATAEAPVRKGPVAAAPSTRRLARELGVDLQQVRPSGPGGRVTPEDVQAFAERAKRPEAAPAPPEVERIAPPPVTPPPPFRFEEFGHVERVPLRSIRRSIARHLSVAWSQIPHVTHMDVADITDLENFRRRHREQVEKQGGALSPTIFMLKATAMALRKFPRFNSTLDMDSEEIVIKHYCNIGVAVDTDRGLLVPVIRDVDRKSILELAVELKELAEKTRQGKADSADLTGGAFTITNVGPMGGTGFTPIINHPETAILGMAQARLQPVVKGDMDNYEIVPRLMLPLIITFDHRVLDGAEAARFLTTIIRGLANPENLLMML